MNKIIYKNIILKKNNNELINNFSKSIEKNNTIILLNY